MEASGAAGPEVFARIVACKCVEIADLRAVAAGDADDLMFQKMKSLAGLFWDVGLFDELPLGSVAADDGIIAQLRVIEILGMSLHRNHAASFGENAFHWGDMMP